MPFEQTGLGERDVKGIEERVRVYRVALKPGEAVPEAEAGKRVRSPSKMPHVVAALAVVALVAAGSAIVWLKPWNPREEPASVARMAFPMPEQPSIAVLPLENLSGDSTQDYWIDGTTEAIITALTKTPDVFVIARNSSFTYKGPAD